MVSERPKGRPAGGQGPRPVVTQAGSINRGFASSDPERQREIGEDAAGAGKAPENAGKRARERRGRDSGAAAPAAGRGREQARGDGEGAGDEETT